MADWSIRRLSTGEIDLLYLDHFTQEVFACPAARTAATRPSP
jgi:hypothetical protein